MNTPPIATTRRSTATRSLLLLLGLTAAGAFSGGIAFLLDPSGATSGLETTLLTRTPFADFRGPGVLLVGGFGLPASVLLLGVWRRPHLRVLDPLERATGHHWAWTGTIALGLGLASWIVVQIALIEASWLQPAMLVVGVALAGLPATAGVRRDLPPRGQSRGAAAEGEARTV